MENTGQVSPFILHVELTELLAKETGCQVSWGQNTDALTSQQLRDIREKMMLAITARMISTARAEIQATLG